MRRWNRIMKFITSWLTKNLNYLYNNTWLVCCCIAAIFISSCKETTDQLGLGVLDDVDLSNSSIIDTFTVETEMVLSSDEVVTSGTSILMLGSYQDAHLGDVNASSYFQLLLNDEFRPFASNLVIDSVVLYADYSGYFYGDTTQPQTIQVHKVTERINDDSTYYVYSKRQVGKLLGEKTVTMSPNHPFALLNIKLDNSFGQEILTNSYTSNDVFKNIFYGLRLSPKNTSPGAVVGLAPNSIYSRLYIFYHDDLGPNQVFTLNYSSSAKKFNNIEFDRSSTNYSGLINEGDAVSSTLTNNVCALQASAGVRVKLSIPGLKSFRDSIGDVAINRAEMGLFVSPGTYKGFYENVPPSLLIYEYDENGVISKEADGTLELAITDYYFSNGVPVPFLEHLFIADSQLYRIMLTNYVKDYFLGKRDNTDLVLSASGNGFTINRLLFEDNKSGITNKKMKFILYYSKRN